MSESPQQNDAIQSHREMIKTCAFHRHDPPYVGCDRCAELENATCPARRYLEMCNQPDAWVEVKHVCAECTGSKDGVYPHECSAGGRIRMRAPWPDFAGNPIHEGDKAATLDAVPPPKPRYENVPVYRANVFGPQEWHYNGGDKLALAHGHCSFVGIEYDTGFVKSKPYDPSYGTPVSVRFKV